MEGNGKADAVIDPGAVRKALVIGLDGASWDIMDPLLANGELPNLARLLAGGVRATLRSTVPPLTAVAWPSCYMGKNPGRHGLFAFRSIDVSSYEAVGDWISAQPIVGQTMFDYLGALGLPVYSYLAPITYPVWPINGVMVAGYPTPDLSKVYSYPAELAQQVPPMLDSNVDLWESSPDEVLPVCFAAAERWADTVERLVAEDRYHFYMVVENLTDYLVHRFWKLRDPSFPTYDPVLAARFGDVIAECYRVIDAAIGRMMSHVPNNWVVAVVSDHGGGRGPTKWFHANSWLRQQELLQPCRASGAKAARGSLKLVRSMVRGRALKGLLLRLLPGIGKKRLASLTATASAIDFQMTRAYAVDIYQVVGGIAINLRGRQQFGMVEPGAEYERLRDRVLSGLLDLRDPSTGQFIVQGAWRREELYQGPFAERAPDVLYLLNPDYRCGRRQDQMVTEIDTTTLQNMSGSHRMEGVLALHSPGVFCPQSVLENAQIIDFLPTLFHGMGLPVPADVDGEVLAPAFLPDYLAAHPVRTGAPLGQGQLVAAGVYDQGEEEGIKSSLRGFGYVE